MSDKTDLDETALGTSGAMYLRRFRLEGFRSCNDVDVPLRPTLTLLVGENNAGKSNIIQALRLATTPLSGRRTRYFDADDVTRGREDPVRLTTLFADLTPFQQAEFIEASQLNSKEATRTLVYRLASDGSTRHRVDSLVGPTLSTDSEPEKWEKVNHVYLAPLRDAQRELDSASGTRLAEIMKYLASPEDQKDFVATATANMDALAKHAAVVALRDGIQNHLTGLTSAIRSQDVGAGFDTPEMHRLARSLRLKMAENGMLPADLSASGLGYANLLFMATVILELQNARHSELTLFLVEEPEAHLHPQLQAVLLDFLREQASASITQDPDRPAGRIQVIATTHSPNLASAVGIDNVVVLRSIPRPASSDLQTVAISIADLNLEPGDARKIDQYLDATRSELLFARRALLVEGIAEAVLVPVLARHCVFASQAELDIRNRRTFLGASIINVGSVDFSPYLRLLLGTVGGQRLVDRLVVITDGDPPVASEKVRGTESPQVSADQAGSSENEEDPAHYNRAADLRALGRELDAEAVLIVAEAPHTLEADLLVPGSNNDAVLREAYLAQKPKSQRQWGEVANSDDPAQAFYEKLRASKKVISKGQFAHDVARLIHDGRGFACPDYLVTAIRGLMPEDACDS